MTSGKVYRSSDNGSSWKYAGISEINTFAANASKGYLFAGTSGIYRSTDGGNNWTYKSLPFKILALVTNGRGDIFAGTEGNGVYTSVDDGYSWFPINTGLPGGDYSSRTVYSLAINSLGYLYAGTSRGVYHSIDNANSWSKAGVGLPETSAYSVIVDSSGNVLAACGGIYRSTNNGETWNAVLDTYFLGHATSLATGASGLVFAGLGFALGDAAYVSRDSGLTWTSFGLANSQVLSICALGNTLFAGTSGGVFRSHTASSNWTMVSAGLRHTVIRSLVVARNNVLFAGADYSGVYRSTNRGEDWVRVAPGNDISPSIVCDSFGHVLAVQANRFLIRSTDNGISWSEPDTTFKSSYIRVLAIGSGGQMFAGANGGILRSTDNGSSWTKVFSTVSYRAVESFAFNLRGDVFAAAGDTIYRSRNNGVSWIAVNNTRLPSGVQCLAVSQQEYIYAGTSQDGIYKSTDNGVTWVQMQAASIKTQNVASLAFDSRGNLFAGTRSGVFRSTDNGVTWAFTGLSPSQCFSLAIDSAGYMFAGTIGDGVFRSINSTTSSYRLVLSSVLVEFGKVSIGQYKDTTLTIINSAFDTLKISAISSSSVAFSVRPTSKTIQPGGSFADTIRFSAISQGMTSGYIIITSNAATSPDTITVTGSGVTATTDVVKEDATPSAYSVSQNYPNPFNPSTVIRYELPRNSFVTLKVFSSIGQEVVTLVSAEQQPGVYSIQLDASRLASGVYFYRLQAGVFVDTKKLVVVR
jgi:photosystem II stability/assembly factor-like uncharacterized protein